MTIDETVKRAALEAAQRSWYGHPSFDRAVLLAVEAAFEAAAALPATRDMEASNG
jgi:hypothetical protein